MEQVAVVEEQVERVATLQTLGPLVGLVVLRLHRPLQGLQFITLAVAVAELVELLQPQVDLVVAPLHHLKKVVVGMGSLEIPVQR